MESPDSSLGNVFASTPFLECLAEARFPGKRWSIETFRVGERHFRFLVVRGRAITSVPWLDFHEAVAPPSSDRTTPIDLGYVHRVALATLTAAEWHAAARTTPPGLPSPFIDWSVGPARVDTQNSRRRVRMLERAYGDATFAYRDDDPTALQRCLAWKRDQYRLTGVGDALKDPAAIRLFAALRERGLLQTSTLRAGGALLAAHVVMEWEGRLYSWLPAHDPRHASLGPGRILLKWLMAESRARGHREFDFLIGGEEYKWQFATHARVVGPFGTPPLALRARQLARSTVRSALQRSPPVWRWLQGVRRRLRAS